MEHAAEELLLSGQARTVTDKLRDRTDEAGRDHAANNGGGPTTIIPWGTVTQDEIRNSSEDLYAVLVDRTEGEVNRRLIGTHERAKGDVNLRDSGDAGLRAYFEMYAWFMKTTGLRQSERMAALMTPKPARSEGDLADAI